MAKKTPESYVMDAVCEYLARKKYTFWRQNNGGVYDKSFGGFRKMSKYSINGVSDLIVLKDGQAIFLELKSYKGEMSEDQLKFEEMVEKAGCKYYLIRSIDDIIYYKI